jgi:hypothetical protein
MLQLLLLLTAVASILPQRVRGFLVSRRLGYIPNQIMRWESVEPVFMSRYKNASPNCYLAFAMRKSIVILYGMVSVN